MKKLVTISLIIFGIVVTALLSASLIYYQNSKDLLAQSAKSKNLLAAPIGQTPAIKTARPTAKTTPAKTTPPAIKSAPPVGSTSPTALPANTITLNMTEIAKHNTADNCWLLINSQVYNVTGAISSHPGGANYIIAYCGQEATQAFDTKGGQGDSHSRRADALLNNYLIGGFNQTINPNTI